MESIRASKLASTRLGETPTVNQRAPGVVALLDHDPEAVDLEELRHLAQQPPRQQLEGGVRPLEGIADGLARLHLLEQPRDARILLAQGYAEPFQLVDEVGLAGL